MSVPRNIHAKWQLTELQRQRSHLSTTQQGSAAHLRCSRSCAKPARHAAKRRHGSTSGLSTPCSSGHSVLQAAQERHVEKLLAPPLAAHQPRPEEQLQPPSDPPPLPSEDEQELMAARDALFTAAEVTKAAERVPPGKAVIGPTGRPGSCGRQQPACRPCSLLRLRPGAKWAAYPAKTHAATSPSPAAGDPASLRGIAVATQQAAKLYASLLERRLSAWAESSGRRAGRQFGFRRQHSTAQAALVLRTLQDRYRALVKAHRAAAVQLPTCGPASTSSRPLTACHGTACSSRLALPTAGWLRRRPPLQRCRRLTAELPTARARRPAAAPLRHTFLGLLAKIKCSICSS